MQNSLFSMGISASKLPFFPIIFIRQLRGYSSRICSTSYEFILSIPHIIPHHNVTITATKMAMFSSVFCTPWMVTSYHSSTQWIRTCITTPSSSCIYKECYITAGDSPEVEATIFHPSSHCFKSTGRNPTSS